MHKVLELMDFSLDYTPELLEEQISRWSSEGKIEEGMEKLIPREDILAFLTPIWDCGSRKLQDEKNSTRKLSLSWE